ncbi:MAG: DinB family protein [Balneolaceae bacterium]|jgi:uncharacterized damage-inducible protein DinB
MKTLVENLQSLFERDLKRLIENIEAIPEEVLWESREGVTNSCGVLAQHLVGNLNHFIGKGLGKTGYIRQREKEFQPSYMSKEELIGDIKKLSKTMNSIFNKMDDQMLIEEYPMSIPFDYSTREFLLHLYGHLNYHLGQINYLRRILSN